MEQNRQVLPADPCPDTRLQAGAHVLPAAPPPVHTHGLAATRRLRDLTQQATAQAMGVTQSRVSAIERGGIDRAELATLQSYIAALGGRLELVADFDNEKIILG